MNTVTITLPSILELDINNINFTDEQFFQLCHNNPNLRFERTASGELIIMPPTGSITSDRNADLTYQLRSWNRKNKLGKTFDSSGGFIREQWCKPLPRCILGKNGTLECFN